MMAVAAGQLLQVHRRTCVMRESTEELLRQFGIEGPDLLRRNAQIVYQQSPTGQINGTEDQTLVHRQDRTAVADNALPVRQGLVKCLTQRDPDILRGVMVVHISIPLAGNLQVEPPVTGEQRQHMIEETYAGIDRARSVPFQDQADPDIRLPGFAAHFSFSHAFSSRISLTASTSFSICSGVPMVIRL